MALAGIALFAAAAWGVLVVFLFGAISAQTPDPNVPSGDPCCGHPDTWGQVATGFLSTLVVAVLVGTLFALAVALIARGAIGRWLRPHRLAFVPAASVLVTALAMALALMIGP